MGKRLLKFILILTIIFFLSEVDSLPRKGGKQKSKQVPPTTTSKREGRDEVQNHIEKVEQALEEDLLEHERNAISHDHDHDHDHDEAVLTLDLPVIAQDIAQVKEEQQEIRAEIEKTKEEIEIQKKKEEDREQKDTLEEEESKEQESNSTIVWPFTRSEKWTERIQRKPTPEEQIPPTSLDPCRPSKASEEERQKAVTACHVSKGITLTTSEYTTPMHGKIGNALSPYWMGRALAFLAGVRFKCVSERASWLALLPSSVPAPPPGQAGGCLDKFAKACEACSFSPENWLYSHRCAPFAIAYIWADIVRDTRAALVKYFAANPQLHLPVFEPHDVVIHDRCDHATFLHNSEYGNPAFSFFNTIPPSTRRIFFVSNPTVIAQVPKCRMKNTTMIEFLHERYPHAQILYAGSDDPAEDFAKLVYAPILYVNPSTFSFWAALANNGTAIHSVPTYGFPFYIPNWHWSPAPVVMGSINSDPRFVNHPDFTPASNPVQGEDYDAKTIQLVLDYLKTH